MGAVGRMMGRRKESSAPGSDLSGVEQLELIDITLVAEFEGEAKEVPRLGLRFDSGGLSVRKDSESLVQIPWVSLRQLQTMVHESSGSTFSVELAVQSDRKQHRFRVPNVSPGALSDSLAAIAALYAQPGIVTPPEQPKKGRGR